MKLCPAHNDSWNNNNTVLPAECDVCNLRLPMTVDEAVAVLVNSIQAALATLDGVRLVAVEEVPEGVPEVVYFEPDDEVDDFVSGGIAFEDSAPGWARYRFDGIVNAAKEKS